MTFIETPRKVDRNKWRERAKADDPRTSSAVGWDKEISDVARRMSQLEGSIAGTVGPDAARAAAGILPSTTTIGGVPIGGDVGPPGSVTAVSGALFDKVYVDLTIVPPSVGHATAYDVEISTRDGVTYTFWKNITTVSETPRVNDLLPGQTYGVRVASINATGGRSAFTSWFNFTSATDSTLPAQTSGLAMYSGLRMVIAKWNDNTEQDVARGAGQYIFQIDGDQNFPAATTYYTTAAMIAVQVPFANTRYFGRVAAIDNSGNQGPWSNYAYVDVGQAVTNDLGTGIIVSDHIVTAGLDAAVIKFGTMTGDRIQANTLDATKIKTSELTAADITLNGGSLKAGLPPATGIVFNSQGIRQYKAGQLVCVLDANGDATFNNVTITGTFQTATSGPRMRIQSYVDSYLANGNVAGQVIEFIHSNGALIGSKVQQGQGATQTTLSISGAFGGFAGGFPPTISMSTLFDGSSNPMRTAFYTDSLSLNPIPLHTFFSMPDQEPYALLKNLSAEWFRPVFGALSITKSFAPFPTGTDAPLKIGKTQDTSGNVLYNIIAGANYMFARYGTELTTFYINSGSPGSGSGVVSGGQAYSGRWGVGFTANAQFCHNNFRGDNFDYGLMQWSSGEVFLSGRNRTNILCSDQGYNFISVAHDGVWLHGASVNVPSLFSTTGGQLLRASSGRLYYDASSRRFKKDIQSLKDDPLGPQGEQVLRLRPRTFRSILEHELDEQRIGLIAEEVAAVEPMLVTRDNNGDPQSIEWGAVTTLLLEEVQELRKDVNQLKRK